MRIKVNGAGEAKIRASKTPSNDSSTVAPLRTKGPKGGAGPSLDAIAPTSSGEQASAAQRRLLGSAKAGHGGVAQGGLANSKTSMEAKLPSSSSAGGRDLSLVAAANKHLTSCFEQFKDGDHFTVAVVVDSISRERVEEILEKAGFTAAPSEHPYHLPGGAYKVMERSGVDIRYLVSMSSDKNLDSFLGFVSSFHARDTECYMGPLTLGWLVHSREGKAVRAPAA